MKLNELERRELCELLRDVVRIKSINPPGNEQAVTDYLFNYLQCEGFEPMLVPTRDAHRNNIVVKLQGVSHSDAVIFTGHQDVVPVSEAESLRWNYEPFGAQLENNRVYGRGAADMKSGVCAFVFAFVLMKRYGIIPKRDIILAITVDEEDNMSGSKSLINTNLFESATSVIVCEPTSMKLCNVGKGRTYARVSVHGKTAHGSRPGVGQNAVDIAVDLINRVQNADFSAYTHPTYGESFWRVLAINAGVEPQVVPDFASMTIDARLSVLHSPDDVWERFDELAAQTCAKFDGAKIEYEVIDKRSPFITDSASPVVQRIYVAARSAQIVLEEDFFTGTTDGTQFAKIGIAPVIIGPGSLAVVHRENEYVELDELYSACELYHELMKI